ncbi:Na+ dependent nucleoside transporter N-terminal domain-containing protein, partial [Neobacillus fumarioli]|uniref:Na+ dependent nucleoside transporter N-terminal domain-containing protein n=1 Tax=Neobacillus fumarioli TaxID=105229 RepID=UPI002738413F
MKYIIAIIGLLVVFGLAYLASNDRKNIKIKPIILMVIIQVVLSALLLNTTLGLELIKGFAA